MIAQHEITGVILCGGSAERMNGVDKPLQRLHGLPLVERVRARLAPQVGPIILSANRHLTEYGAWGDLVVADAEPGLGPLGGIASACQRVETPYLFCCPGDAPWLSMALVSRLAAALSLAQSAWQTEPRADSQPLLAVPHDGARQQHLFFLCDRRVASSLQAYLAESHRSVHGWIAQLSHVVVDAADLGATFTNLNTQADLRAAEESDTHRAAAANSLSASSLPASSMEHS